MGMPIIDVENNVRYPSLIQYAVKQRLAQESLAEELRILYVALTRAKERLFLYGNLDNFDNSLLKWQRTSEWEEVALPEGQLRNAKCFLDWIGPALARHSEHLFGEAEGYSALSIPEINSRWEIQIHRSLTSSMEESREKNLGESKDENVEMGSEKSFGEDATLDLGESWFCEVNRRLSWQYPHLNSVRKIAKTSVSELKRQYNWHANEEAPLLPTLWERTESMKRPKFLQAEQPLTAAERGTAMHKAMQHLPFKEWGTSWPASAQMEQINCVMEFLSMLEQREILSAEEKNSIQPAQIVQFLGTPLGERLFSAEQILREVPFTLTFPSEGQSNILVQGVIDAVIIRTDEFNAVHAEILDYKTDSIHTDKMDSTAVREQILRERYVLQLSLYALAIERLLSINVSHCTLYSFTLGREIAISEELRSEIQAHEILFQDL